MRHLIFIFFSAALILSFSCKKQPNPGRAEVAFYLLGSTTQLLPQCSVDPSTATLLSAPFITNDQIISYSTSEHSFFLTTEAGKSIESLKDRTLFAVTVNREVVYYGIYKPFHSSSGCSGSLTMGGFSRSNRYYEALIRLGYPGQLQGVIISDLRNDHRLISALRNQGKLR